MVDATSTFVKVRPLARHDIPGGLCEMGTSAACRPGREDPQPQLRAASRESARPLLRSFRADAVKTVAISEIEFFS